MNDKSADQNSPKYIIITPVKDEERSVEHTLKSVVRQSVKPVKWIIVDDGSTDMTPEIINRYEKLYPFMRKVENPTAGTRQTGSAVIRAFNYGLEFIEGVQFDFIVKLDCDLSFGEDYFEKLINRFSEDKQLGIGSGAYLERRSNGKWQMIKMPFYHAAGASKVIRRECFEEIKGFVVAAGWDTVDEIRAMSLGWRTRHFSELQMKHHKKEGSGIGTIKTNVMHGEIYYRTGGSLLFFIPKLIKRIADRPYLIGAIAMLKGYMRAVTGRGARLVTNNEAMHYRSLLMERMRSQLKNVINSFLGKITKD